MFSAKNVKNVCHFWWGLYKRVFHPNIFTLQYCDGGHLGSHLAIFHVYSGGCLGGHLYFMFILVVALLYVIVIWWLHWLVA